MVLLLVVLFLDILGTGIMFAVLPFLALSLGASASQVTLLFTMLPLMQLWAGFLLITLGLAWPYLVGAGIVAVVWVITELGAKTLVPPGMEM